MAALKSHIASLSVACLRESREIGEITFFFPLAVAVICLLLVVENGHYHLPSKPQQQKAFATHQFYKNKLHSLPSSFENDLSTQSSRKWNDNAIFSQHTLNNSISLCNKRKLSMTPGI